MLKEKKEKNWLLSIIKFMRDKLKELIKKIFARDLSFNQRLDKEIKELQEKLGSGELSEEEFARALERLTALQDLKLRLQMAVVGWIVTMFAEIFGIELAAVIEASAEKEDKKAEKTSLKEEAIKEVRKEVEIKVEEEKKAKQEEPKKEVCPQKPAEKKPVASGIKFDSKGLKENIAFKERDANTGVNGRGTTPPTNGQGNKLDNGKKNESASCAESCLNGNVNKKEADNLYTELAKELANSKIGVWKGAENEGSVNNAQAKVSSEFTGAKVNNFAEGQSVGKT